MTASWATSVEGLGDVFEVVRAKGAHLAKQHRCSFWWKPEADGWHRFVFTNHDVSILFEAYLRKDVVKKGANRIRRLWVSRDEIRLFADHCVHIRSVFEYAIRMFAESTEAERKAMNAVAPRFFEDLAQVFNEFSVSSACRVTDPWIDSRGNRNLAVGFFTNGLSRFEPLHQRLTQLQASMEQHRDRIEKARNKLTAHADLETIMLGEPIGAATWLQWDQFWKDLGDFVSLVHKHVLGSPFEIRAAMVRGDAEVVLKKLQT
ncbi:MAG: hypothetical protein KGK01_01725 [Bradyrhizobium sp.]|uniref:AbiU2 domain-containing protein n=1 Tax=Bradyrhizobium sp. TaxID=376 RepID=UPI001C294AD5|nr:hypothetical protein [Bradyrhizobium sp.]MBU6463178.1 hypothetical protein [Pseudomonadota bacterium]MDE2066984.1 hypothetical protein [Bradyrhizobium sp.]MDE2241185.1 hypothetical protein [Bradyrhizobium sp.]MDE2473085.1 hypothetical protein [Bradyrhizobium sp.]